MHSKSHSLAHRSYTEDRSGLRKLNEAPEKSADENEGENEKDVNVRAGRGKSAERKVR